MKKTISLFITILFINTSLSASFYEPYFELEEMYFPTDKDAGSIIILTNQKRLYYVLGNDLAYEFPIAVGKLKEDRFYGSYPISRKAKWPSWRPTPSMIEEDPNLPEVVKGGKKNPLGARALYLGDSPFRIHGTNNPKSIGTAASHGCIRMYNKDVKKLYEMVRTWDMVYVK